MSLALRTIFVFFGFLNYFFKWFTWDTVNEEVDEGTSFHNCQSRMIKFCGGDMPFSFISHFIDGEWDKHLCLATTAENRMISVSLLDYGGRNHYHSQ